MFYWMFTGNIYSIICILYYRATQEVKACKDNMVRLVMLEIRVLKDLLDMLAREDLKDLMDLLDHVELREMLDLR